MNQAQEGNGKVAKWRRFLRNPLFYWSPHSHEDIISVQDATQRLLQLVDLIEAVTEDIGHHHLGIGCKGGAGQCARSAQTLCLLAPDSHPSSISEGPHPFWRDTSVLGQGHTQI